jgi:hypothetical protein
LIAVPVLVALFIAALSLLLSSLSRNARYVKVFIFVVYFLSKAISELLMDIFNSPYCRLIAVEDLVKQLGTFIFNIEPAFPYPGWLSLAAVIAVSLGAYLLLYKRIGKLEAQIESGN